MSSTFTGLPLNKSTSNDSDLLLGQECEFEDLDFSTTGNPRLSQTPVLCRRVKNGHSSAITAGQAVKWKTGAYGTQVVPAGSTEVACGVATGYVSSIAVGAHFNIVRKGFGLVKNSSAADLAQGERLVTAASGEVVKQTAAPASLTAAMTQVNAVVGMATTAITASTSGRAWIDCTNN